jgi:hypothetical protein
LAVAFINEEINANNVLFSLSVIINVSKPEQKRSISKRTNYNLLHFQDNLNKPIYNDKESMNALHFKYQPSKHCYAQNSFHNQKKNVPHSIAIVSKAH